ncbi:MAG: hypothetical protein JEZ08_23230 [Clostridiales bacterium]|nr:hypothetical protein [Clostridiales bacterium]
MLEQLFVILKSEDPLVEMGKMMSCNGLTYKGKVFCFEYNNQMVFKLGKGFDIEAVGIREYEYLNPFKNKGPMLAWFIIKTTDEAKIVQLARFSLNDMKTNL